MNMSKIDFDLIRRYHKGELSAREMYELEYKAEHDPMLMDILMGMEQQRVIGQEAPLADIRKRIERRVHPQKTVSIFNWKTWSIAATTILCLGIGAYFIFSPRSKEQLASQDNSAAETTPELSDSKSNMSVENYINHMGGDSTSRLADATTNYPKIQEEISKKSRSKTNTNVEKTKALPSPITLGSPRQASSLDSNFVIRKNRSNRLAANTTFREADQISELSPNGSSMKLITGKVVDNSTREPLYGATLKVKNSKDAAVTDSTGDFKLSSSTANPLVEVRAIGYQTQQVPSNILANGRIKLKPEGMIIGNNSPTTNNPLRKEIKFGKAQPIMGWSAYNDYVEEATKQFVYKATGAVTLSFKIDVEGSPVNIKVKSSDNSTLDQRAVEIIKNGPKWRATMNNPSEIILFTIDFQSN